MPFIDDIGSLIKTLRVYLFGRGLVSLGVIAASMIGGPLPALTVAIGGMLVEGFMRIRDQGIYEQNMVDLYRDDIAERLHIAPEEVTRAHLKEAAADNEVIDQALKRQRHKSTISFVTSGLAAAATLGLVGFGLPAILGNFFIGLVGKGLLGSLLKFSSLGIVAGISSLVLHDGLELAVGHKTGIAKAAAHDRIVAMERGMGRGWGVSKEQVYSVMVAGSTELQSAIAQRFGKSYAAMHPAEQSKVLSHIGVDDEMQAVAQEINNGRMRPAHLAYMIADTIPPKPDAPQEETGPVKSFVQSLGLAPRAASHVAQLDAARQQQVAQEVQRV